MDKQSPIQITRNPDGETTVTEVKFDAVLSMDDPNFAQKLAEAIGAKPGETIEITTPQFEREDGLKPIENPADLFNSLTKLNKETLLQIGLRQWSDYGLWLFPYQWYDHIPEGMELLDINGATEIFKRGVTDDDMRFGVLAFGIVPDFERAALSQKETNDAA